MTDPTAAPALSTISSIDYLFAGMKGYVSKMKVSRPVVDELDPACTSVAINGRLSIWQRPGVRRRQPRQDVRRSTPRHWRPIGATRTRRRTAAARTAATAPSRTSTSTLTYGYVMYGDQDGHFYVVSKNAGGTSCTATSGAKLTGYPVQPAAGEPITTAPLFDNGIVLFGTSSGNVFVYNRRTVAAGTPALLRTYKLGSAVSSIAFNANTNSSAGAYMIGTANGKLYFIDKVSDGDAFR